MNEDDFQELNQPINGIIMKYHLDELDRQLEITKMNTTDMVTNDSTKHYITIPSDSIQFRQPQFTKTDHIVGGTLTMLWFIGLVISIITYKHLAK